jgi:hypothetical protein
MAVANQRIADAGERSLATKRAFGLRVLGDQPLTELGNR